MSYHGPVLSEFGNALVIFPTADRCIPAELAVEFELLRQSEHSPELLTAWARSLEASLGVRDVHRIAIAHGEPAARQHIRRGKTVKAQAERKRAAALSQPLRAPHLPSEVERDLKALARAEQEAAQARKDANAARDRKDHKAHRAAVGRERDAFARIRTLRKAISTARTKQIDAHWAAWAISETEALEGRRGDRLADQSTEVSAWLRDPESGAQITGEDGLPVLGTERAKTKRANSRDPLLSLLNLGHLTADQFDAGQDARDLYQARSEGLGSQMRAIGGIRAPSQDNSVSIWGGVKRGQKLQRLGTLEREVALRCRHEPAALAMLRSVCGAGVSLTSHGKGRGFDRNLAALTMALDVAAAIRPQRA